MFELKTGMKISQSNNIYSNSFKAKKKEIRAADDIQRQAKLKFPCLSPTYMRKFYSVFKNGDTYENINQTLTRKKIDRNISVIRQDAKEYAQSDFTKKASYSYNVNYALSELIGLKLLKSGNCAEQALAVLSALGAKGYNNTNRAILKLNVQFINKKTKNVDFETETPLGHQIVTTTMNNDKYTNDNKIIIDPWLGFTDSNSGAKAKYKSFFAKDIKDEVENSLIKFKLQQIENKKSVMRSDYDIKTKIVFEENEDITPFEVREIGYYTDILINNK